MQERAVEPISTIENVDQNILNIGFTELSDSRFPDLVIYSFV